MGQPTRKGSRVWRDSRDFGGIVETDYEDSEGLRFCFRRLRAVRADTDQRDATFSVDEYRQHSATCLVIFMMNPPDGVLCQNVIAPHRRHR
jgi:hypothetical protein